MVNSEFHILVTAKANARKIMVMMHVIGHQKRAKEHLGPYAPTLIQTRSRINVTLELNISKMLRKKLNEKVDLSHFISFNNMSYFESLVSALLV